MKNDERKALESIRLSWAPTPDEVWRNQADLHVGGLHEQALADVLSAFEDAKQSPDASPLGVVLTGPAGSGKTHLLGQVRERVQNEGGYFFLIRLLDAQSFWRSTVIGMLDDLGRPSERHDTQLKWLLWQLASDAGLTAAERERVVGNEMIDPTTLTKFVTALFKIHPRHRRASQQTLRALVLSASQDPLVQDLGDAYLQSVDDVTAEEFGPWGIKRANLDHQGVAENISRLLALTGPSLLAIDQLDTLVAQSASATGDSGPGSNDLIIEHVAHGLMSLRETLTRTAPIVSCLAAAWDLIGENSVASVQDRFRSAPELKRIPSADVGKKILTRRFAASYRALAFEPPYPSWPVAPAAFERAQDFTPRQLLIKVDKHIRSCVANGAINELTDFRDTVDPPVIVDPKNTSITDRFEQLKDAADVSLAFDSTQEDQEIPTLLTAGLTAWMHETDAFEESFDQDPLPSAKPALHARLRHTLNSSTSDEEHWCFRAVSASNHTAALNRVQKACTAAGLDSRVAKRKLILIRNEPWSTGQKTRETIAAFHLAGGVTLPLTDDDIRTLSALRALIIENPPELDVWLATHKPAHSVTLFRDALTTIAESHPNEITHSQVELETVEPARQPRHLANEVQVDLFTDSALATPQNPDVPISPKTPPPRVRPAVPIGHTVGSDAEVRVDLVALRKHTAIFAGSGSGKTVLIRRLVEECALQGVSSIILDPNNDLSRLGTPWPEGSRTWTGDEEAKSVAYLKDTDVVIWTPRRDSGRPLSFQPLPDFAAVMNDADEFSSSIDSAFAALAPRAMAEGTTAKAKQAQAVLKQTLQVFGRKSQGNLGDLIALLEDLPEDISELRNAVRIAAELAENLKASTANDPMFGGAGTPVDPGVLLTPKAGYKARVSVINLSGLVTTDQRESFVNQLQMALFAWIKKNPAGDRPLGGLFVMDEAQNFAPSERTTACTYSTLALASQARKYGLGLVFATQSPKGLNNKISGNAATQLYGMLNSPVQIQAAKEMAHAKGGNVPDIGKLPAGQFYAAVEGTKFRKTQTPLCLSYHPQSPPTEEEVLELARG